MKIKNIIKIFSIFMFISLNILSAEKYVPKNENEKRYLEELRKKTIKLAIQKSEFTDYKIQKESLNDKILDLFKNYLDLNIEVVNGDWKDTYEKFKNGEVDAIGLITRNSKRRTFTEFTKKLFLENLYLASKSVPIESKESLKNQTIYVDKDDNSIGILYKYLKKEGLTVKIKKVDNIFKYLDTNIVYMSGFYLNGLGNKITVGKTPGTSIGLNPKYKKLIPILNNAISEKYEKEVMNYIGQKNLIVQRENFFNQLTEEEKEFLKNTKKIKIGLEKNSISSSYKNGDFIGVIPDILNRISQISGVNFEYSGDNKWGKLKQSFDENKIRVLPVSINNSIFKNIIFSKNIYNIKIYFIANKLGGDDRIGVEKNTVYDTIARDYFFEEQIMKFSSKTEVVNAIKKNQVSGILMSQADSFNNIHYSVEVLETIPVNLAFHKDDKILRDIFNKALTTMGKQYINQIVVLNQMADRNELLSEAEKTENLYKILAGIAIVVAFLIVILIYKILSEKKLAKSLRIDFLTNLQNRVSFNEFCQNSSGRKGVAILIDLNNFKQVNDKFSHKLGDDVLVEVGKIISKVFKNDYNFRISGDEFYSFIKLKNYKEKLEELKNESKNSEFLTKYDISFCLGYYKKNEKETLEQAFKYAGLAMHKAKEKKSYTMIEASKELLKEEERKLKIRELIKESIEVEFYPVFQPKVEAKTGKIKGAEALCRWKNKDIGMIFPNEFIPLSEELKLVHLIDYQIAKTAIKKAKEWINDCRVSKEFRISFNLSMQTFDRSDVVKKIQSFIEETKIDGKNVEIEITESVISNNISDALIKIKKLKSIGVTVALDDFTAGHSTASLLPVLPIDVVKFDKSLLDLYNRDGEKGKIIYKNLIKMVKDLKMETVSEGVETENDAIFLKNEKIDILQGYFYGRPELEEEFLKKVKER